MEEQLDFHRDTWVEIDLDAIEENITMLKKFMNDETEIIAIVKANGYGHGDAQVAKTALEAGATRLAVAFMDEALSLRNNRIEAPILVLGASRPKDAHLAAKYNITLTVFQLEWLQAAQSYLHKTDKLFVHLKIDSGMGRIGIRKKEELNKIEAFLKKDNRFVLEGVFTHFATADEFDPTYLNRQLNRFLQFVRELKAKPRCIHCSNSAATLRFPRLNFNAVRFGIAMYGLSPSQEMINELPFSLKEAFSLQTKLVHIKKVKKGDKISYGATYEAEEETWIGTLPIGYADGWIRKLSGQEVLIDGIRVPIVGRICMDQCMIKLPNYFPVGTNVTLIGSQNKETISINEIAAKLETINYEIPCMISSRVPRIYKRDGQIIDIRNPVLFR
ncbi:alanine racemase [Bacillus aquiflavi]|uniref:Alanine racemase n=1 Tax=Bacillus aquiflavi TaxID=2672567 RepID=A0A6B3W016_9BACI|nr:alanine racemase [Bacillus aquiflavi]MBA4536834.1 alanine racemase [Bacillus aquiflavi]NEY81201.1 alanine racemase [Bacillus aquiflavi]